MNLIIFVIAEMLLFLGCGIVLGLCAVSPKVMLVLSIPIFIKGLLWDAYFLGGIYPHSIVISLLCISYLLLGWVFYFEKGVKRVGRVIGEKHPRS